MVYYSHISGFCKAVISTRKLKISPISKPDMSALLQHTI
jgi:hypothetical protein